MPGEPLPVQLSDAAFQAVVADVLIMPVFDDDEPTTLGLPAAPQAILATARKQREFKAKPYEQFWIAAPSDWKCARILAIGAGARRDYTSERARRLASAGGLAARNRNLGRVAFVQRGAGSTNAATNGHTLASTASAAAAHNDPIYETQVIAEGLVLCSFDGDTYKTYKTSPRDAGPLVDVQIIAKTGAPDALKKAVEKGRILGECSNVAKGLANEPSNKLTPKIFAERARKSCADVDLPFEVLDEKQIADLKMGMLLGVAQGSLEPPRLIVMRYTPPGATGGPRGANSSGPVLGLVGKGVTFDTGGISIKPAEGMERMKDDMAGGAAVIAAMRAIALLKPPIRVIGVVPMVENMPSGTAIKPGDVLTSASGKTVEVTNTDAEGRLILGDALWYAREQGATHLVDVATLTGAIMVALGKTTSGLFATPDWWRDVVHPTADRAGDRSWPMPLFDDYLEQLKSEVADMNNVGGRPGGAITAAMFLKEFTGGLPWAHFDIAATAWAEEAKPYQPKGATGIAVRTLAELAFTSDRWVPTLPDSPAD
jgi:leucyl aminopeptidase